MKSIAYVGMDVHEIEVRIAADDDATDRQIDRLVYELYDLTDEDIRIVEESTK